MKLKLSWTCLVTTALALACSTAQAQWGQRGPQVNSPELSDQGEVTFRILAPNAESVRLSAGDIPDLGRGGEMEKDDQGIWSVKVGPIPAGAYRYNFNVDGVSVIDPRNPSTSESNANTWSLVVVPGSPNFDTTKVPHGAVAEVTYYSEPLQRFRRMHIYTPPGYEAGSDQYPVFYLLHGASDSDNSWSTVGRAGFILDNLIAAGKAKPMIVVMPAGHTSSAGFRPPANSEGRPRTDEFTEDFLGAIMPYVEANYRVLTERKDRAIAGLSMGGAQTLNIGIPNLDRFAYLGVYSSGVFGITGNRQGGGPSWEEQQKEKLQDATLKEGLQLVWFATGKDDFLIETSRATVELLKQHGFEVVYKETEGGHTWVNWRDYLAEFAPLLFQ
ncbi:MAG: alpha/beta hydrolase-fold protein, partial [Verrucomicrobiota bacterium]|nr:alpha/beta hydrolase-fold protein [Verrucomicrobiota bacterium]